MFDEFVTPPLSVDYPAPEIIALIAEVVAPVHVYQPVSPSLTTVDQDAPSLSNSQTTPETQPPLIPNDLEEDNHDIEVAHMGNDPYFGILFQKFLLINLHHWILFIQFYMSKLFFVTETMHPSPAVRTKTYKDALNQSCMIEAMQEELNYSTRMVYMLSSFLISQDFSKGAQPTEKHLHAVKRIFRYLKGTVNRGLWYPKDSSITLTTFADANHAGCQDTHRSTSSSMQFLGDRLVSWSSKRQKSVAIYSTEAEYCYVGMLCSNPLDEITAYRLWPWIQ
ncbi:hypothetical protein Tco_0509093 [Tanacetum coccineum]